MKIISLAILWIGAGIVAIAQDYDPGKEMNAPHVLMEGWQGGTSRETGEEWRGFWVDAWNKGVFDAVQVAEVVRIARSYGYNAIVVQVRRRGDAIYLPTYPNTEPRMSGLPSGFDALAEMIRHAHAAGIEVHAWVTTLLISTSQPPSSPEHVFNRHPEYLTEDYSGNHKIGEGYYLDPGHPDALAWNTRVVMDLVSHYDLDGIHFDYVRYPQQNSGYNPVAVSRYNSEFGLSGKPACDDEQFGAWRRRQITDFLRQMYGKIIAVKPHLKVTAATFGARNDAYHNRFQDWARWMNEGLIDANLPMNYTVNLDTFKARTLDIVQHSYGRHVYVGVGSYLLNPEDIVAQSLHAREYAPGLLFFSYASNSKSGEWLGTFEFLRARLFSAPAAVPEMPWKTKPRTGSWAGRVCAAGDKRPVYNARLVVPALRKTVKTDAAGEFGLYDLAPGTYQAECQVPGFKTATRLVTIEAGAVASLDFAMEEGDLASIVLDTDDAVFLGEWTTGVSATDKYGSDYRFIGPGNGGARATFAFPEGLTGRYLIYTWYSAGANRTPGACYRISHAGGTSEVLVDQRQNQGKWQLLGAWDLSWSAPGTLVIIDNFKTGQVVIADAVLLEKADNDR